MASVAVGCSEEEPAGTSKAEDESSDKDEPTEEEEAAPPAKDGGKKPSGDTKADAGKAPSSGGSKDAGAPAEGEEETPAKPEAGGGAGASLFCDALKVVEDKCQNCHGAKPVGGAPMSLVTYDDFMAEATILKGKKVWEATKVRAHDAKDPMPPANDLKPEQLSALDKWIEDGAKPGDDPTCAGNKTPGPDGEAPKPELAWPPAGTEKCAEIRASGPTATVQPGQEPHPQFIVDAPWGSQKVHATGFRPITENTTILHHWILYPNTGGSAAGMLTGWAPGGEPEIMPENIGVEVPSGPRSLRLDVHYNNLLPGAKTESDTSGVEVCWTSKLRENPAGTYMGFAGIPIIPAGTTEADKFQTTGTCNVRITGSKPVFLLGTSAHAHTLAYHMKFEVKRGSETIVWHDAPFNFEEQLAVPFKEPFELKNGDIVYTRCFFTNESRSTVTFGENTGNEMCFNFATYYPVGGFSCGGGGGIPTFPMF